MNIPSMPPIMNMTAPSAFNMNMKVPSEVGEWDCPDCGNVNWAKRLKCHGRQGGCEVEKKPEFVRRGVEDWGGRRSASMIGPQSMGISGYMRSSSRDRDGRQELGRRPRGSGLVVSPGDWECPRCWNINFKYRKNCNGTKRHDPQTCGLRRPTFEEFDIPLVKPFSGEPTTDWDCWRCGCVNFTRKEECWKCHVAKEKCQSEDLRQVD